MLKNTAAEGLDGRIEATQNALNLVLNIVMR
jgi:hypothetical protein